MSVKTGLGPCCSTKLTTATVNLGKWVLRHLFALLIEEEIRRDRIYITELNQKIQRSGGLSRENAPTALQLPASSLAGWHQNRDDNDSVTTPRAPNGHIFPSTPGLSIAVATPGISAVSHGTNVPNHLPSTIEGPEIAKRSSRLSGDYFSSNLPSQQPQENGITNPSETVHSEPAAQPPVPTTTEVDKSEKPKETKESGSLFGMKFRKGIVFPKKLGKSPVEAKQVVVERQSEESLDKSSVREEKVIEDNLLGVLQKMRYDYEDQLHHIPHEPLQSSITPSLPTETPVLNPLPFTSIIIQEDQPDSGEVADLYRGTVTSVGQDADMIEKVGPMWLGDLLLRVSPTVFETSCDRCT